MNCLHCHSPLGPGVLTCPSCATPVAPVPDDVESGGSGPYGVGGSVGGGYAAGPDGQPPQYGQPQYGQPQYGQPQYGQPQYGQPPYQPPYGQPQYGQPQYGPSFGGGYPMMARIPNHLVWAIVVTVCCCLPGGIVAIVYAAKVSQLETMGDFRGAMEASNNAKKWIIISACVGVVLNVTYVILRGVTQN